MLFKTEYSATNRFLCLGLLSTLVQKGFFSCRRHACHQFESQLPGQSSMPAVPAKRQVTGMAHAAIPQGAQQCMCFT